MKARVIASLVFRRLVPEPIQIRLDCLRAIPAWRRAGIIFVHTPKAAGSAISMALYGQSLGHIYASDIARHASKDFANLPSFSFVREPFARYLSAIRYLQSNYDLLRGAPGLPPDRALLSDPARLLHEWLIRTDLTRANYIFRPQHYYLCDDNGSILPQFIGRFEELDKDIDKVSSWVGHKLQLPLLNVSRAELPKKAPYSLKSEVRQFYARDVEIFRY